MTDLAFLDLVVTADTIHTAAESAVTAVGILDGLIVAVGSREESAGWGTPQTRRVDFGDATITAGLTDAHSHAITGATTTALGVDLSPARSLDDVRAMMRDEAARTPEPGWVLGWALDPNLFSGATITSALLDDSVGDRPAFVRLFDGHAALVSQAALRVANITGPVEFTTNSEVVCDVDGHPTGLLLEEAENVMRAAMPQLTEAQKRVNVRRILEEMAATGLTSVHLMNFDESSIELLQELEREAPLPIRLRCSPFFDAGAEVHGEIERVTRLQGIRGDRWVVDGVKLMLDGTIDNGTAWLHEPDTHGESTKSQWLDPDNYRLAVLTLARRGIDTATHAIGDAAILAAVETIAAIPDEQKAATRHRIEHVETMPARTMERFVASGAIASMQPTHSTLYVWADHTDNWSERLGHERAAINGFRYREVHDAGAVLALGSDWPIAPYDPRQILADAQLRRPFDRPETAPVLPRQALTARMALEGYTSAAAYSVGWESLTGTIEPGRYADLTVFSADPLTTDPEAFARSPIVATLVAGQILRGGAASEE
ncbi:MAG: amidohydrolase [Naasia sp.]|uniref:amidohydrolase n=1 Tax=Naasia sp. TaxID=2546198 RepID=UPI002629DD4B|nr:amidohydrolase [Naasia sp.]MCU1571035.1 amidohydrolase [Naasia sp.]